MPFCVALGAWVTIPSFQVCSVSFTSPQILQTLLQPLMMLRDACEDKHALELAEIVMCIRSRTATKEQVFIDLYMAQYALYSKDSIATKLQKLAVESNFYLVLFNERMSAQKNVIGFNQAM